LRAYSCKHDIKQCLSSSDCDDVCLDELIDLFSNDTKRLLLMNTCQGVR
jgi:hypothetical protein